VINIQENEIIVGIFGQVPAGATSYEVMFQPKPEK